MSNKSALAAFFIAAFPLPGLAANQAKFEGNVSSTTCNVLVNGTGSPTVLLPTVPVASLQSMNSSSGETPFTIELTGCPISSSPVEAKTYFKSDFVDSLNGDLLNQGTARNVSLTLIATHLGYPIDLRQGWLSDQGRGIMIPANSSSANRIYYVRYHSYAGMVQPGSVRSSVQYAIIYP